MKYIMKLFLCILVCVQGLSIQCSAQLCFKEANREGGYINYDSRDTCQFSEIKFSGDHKVNSYSFDVSLDKGAMDKFKMRVLESDEVKTLLKSTFFSGWDSGDQYHDKSDSVAWFEYKLKFDYYYSGDIWISNNFKSSIIYVTDDSLIGQLYLVNYDELFGCFISACVLASTVRNEGVFRRNSFIRRLSPHPTTYGTYDISRLYVFESGYANDLAGSLPPLTAIGLSIRYLGDIARLEEP